MSLLHIHVVSTLYREISHTMTMTYAEMSNVGQSLLKGPTFTSLPIIVIFHYLILIYRCDGLSSNISKTYF